jgi:hypothetical protein
MTAAGVGPEDEDGGGVSAARAGAQAITAPRSVMTHSENVVVPRLMSSLYEIARPMWRQFGL